MLDWFKRSWAQLFILLGLSIGSLLLLTNRRRLPTATPLAPEAPPVELPIVHIHPSDDYVASKGAPVDVFENGTSQVVASINSRHGSK